MQYSWARSDRTDSVFKGESTNWIYGNSKLGIDEKTPLAAVSYGPQFARDFGSFTRDRPWLKWLCLLELCVVGYLIGISVFNRVDCSAPPMSAATWLLTFAIANLLQLWMFVLLRAKAHLPVRIKSDRVRELGYANAIMSEMRHGAVGVFWGLCVFVFVWLIYGMFFHFLYPCRGRSELVNTSNIVTLVVYPLLFSWLRAGGGFTITGP